MPYAWHTPFPIEYGPGQIGEETIYQALRRAVGDGGSAKKETGIDALWRRSKAKALAQLAAMTEKGALQGFPHLATDRLVVWEDELGISPPEGATDDDRRLAVQVAYVEKAIASEPELLAALQAIDVRLSLFPIPRANAWYVQLGKAFEPQDGTPKYSGGAQKSAPCVNTSSDFYVPVLLTIGTVMPTPVDLETIVKAKRFLATALPSWVDFKVILSTGPFLMGVSPMGLVALS